MISKGFHNTNYWIARNYFLTCDERCQVWEEKGIGWVLHHKDPSWRRDDLDRYLQWNIDDLLPMTKSAHRIIHMVGKNNPMYGVHRYGKFAPGYGKHCSEETKKKIGNANIGRKHTEETIKKMSDKLKGENHPMYGKHHSEESRKKMSESHDGQNVGTQWYNNGYTCVRSTECPEGFVPGRLNRGTHWYNNGVNEVKARECPEGFVLGRLPGRGGSKRKDVK